MNRNFRFLVLVALLVFAGPQANAQGIPVYDASSFAQLVTQLDQMSKDYQKQLEQLEQAMEQTNAMTGTRGMGDLANGALEQQLREYLPTSWEDTMNMINAASLPAGAAGTKSIYSALHNTYEPISGSEFMPSDPSGPVAKALDRRTGTTYAALSSSEQAYNNISARIETYEALLDELNNTTDLKASVDLQSRITAENGMILTELLRLTAMQMQQKSSEDNEILVNYKRATGANKYDAAAARKAMELQQ